MEKSSQQSRLTIAIFGLTIMLLYPTISMAQTIAAEEKNLNQKIGILPQEQMIELANSWRSFIKDYGKFPNLPYDSLTDRVSYNYIDNCNLNKSTILNRILEWSALSFGSIDAVLHFKDLESGKIIIKGSFAINYKEDYKNMWGSKREQIDTKDVYATYIFTVKDNKVKTEVTSIEVEFVTNGYSGANYYVPTSKRKYPLDALYPITDYDSMLWKEHLNILKAINYNIDITHKDLLNYIKSYQEDYSF